MLSSKCVAHMLNTAGIRYRHGKEMPTVKAGLQASFERKIRPTRANQRQKSISGWGPRTEKQSARYTGDRAHTHLMVGKNHVVNTAEMAEGREMHTNAATQA